MTVKGINVIVKHNKPKSAQDKGGITKKEGKIQASDVMVVCPSCNKATRVSMSTNDKGQKVRVCKKCNAVLDAKKTVSKKSSKDDSAKNDVAESKSVQKAKESTSSKKSSSAKTTSTEKKSTTTTKKTATSKSSGK